MTPVISGSIFEADDEKSALGGLIVGAIVAIRPLAGNAADSGSDVINLFNQPANTPSLFTFDYAAPASPALSLLGQSGSKIKCRQQPSNPSP